MKNTYTIEILQKHFSKVTFLSYKGSKSMKMAETLTKKCLGKKNNFCDFGSSSTTFIECREVMHIDRERGTIIAKNKKVGYHDHGNIITTVKKHERDIS